MKFDRSATVVNKRNIPLFTFLKVSVSFFPLTPIYFHYLYYNLGLLLHQSSLVLEEIVPSRDITVYIYTNASLVTGLLSVS